MVQLAKKNSGKHASRKQHRWLMLFTGLQFLIWAITGIYMVFLNIHYIHGDSLVHQQTAVLQSENAQLSFAQISQRFTTATNIQLTTEANKPIYLVKVPDEKGRGKWQRVNANTGDVLAEVNEQQAIAIAKLAYTGNDGIAGVKLLTQQAPFELSPRHLPVWQIEFDHIISPTLYISQTSGLVVTKRHSFWRIFDWMFRFHVMDYDDGGNIQNLLLTLFIISGLWSSLAGCYLLLKLRLNTVKRAKPVHGMEQEQA